MKKSKSFRGFKSPTSVTRNGEIIVSSKKRLIDTVIWKGNYVTVRNMIDNHPLELWKMIHNRQKGDRKVSLVRTAYAELKMKIEVLRPDLVEIVNKQHDYHKTLRRLKKDLANGLIGSKESKFRSLGARDKR